MGHAVFMREALRLGRLGLWATTPNPAVGAVVVKGGRVVSGGYHKKAGGPHAEVSALKPLEGKDLKGATMYVTLEPCCHHGRTPPCTGAVIGSGIKSVVVGALDPNPKVAGKGVKALRRAGIDVTVGVLEPECRALNEWYAKYITTGLPFVTLKLASTLDGRIATSGGESQWITGTDARRHVHRMRGRSDAVMVGVNTVLNDDPLLTVRHVKGRDPLRVIVDSTLRTPVDSKVFRGLGINDGAGLIIFTAKGAPGRKVSRVQRAGAKVVELPRTKDGVGVRMVLKRLGEMGVATVLVEGGGRLSASLIKAGMVDRVSLFFSPLILGADAKASIGDLCVKRLESAIRLKGLSTRRFGGDILIEGAIDR